MRNLGQRAAGLAALAIAVAPFVTAAPITFSATVGSRSASATFDTSGTDLIVTVSNTATGDVLVPVDVLTAVFFNVAGGPQSLTRTSAVVDGGSVVHFGGTDPGNVVGGEWAYLGGLSGAPGSASYGISSVGLGLFGPSDVFPGTNLQGPASPDGLQYGLSSAGDNPATGNAPVTGDHALIQNTAVFTLSGLPVGFAPSAMISGVNWQYGTDLSEPNIPEPTSAALLAVAGLMGLRRRGSAR